MSEKPVYVRAGKVIDDVRAIGKLPYLHRPKGDDDTAKPHGRLAAAFLIKFRHGTCPAYVDLSVMPKARNDHRKAA